MLKRLKKCVYNKLANGQKATKKGSGDINYNGGDFSLGFLFGIRARGKFEKGN